MSQEHRLPSLYNDDGDDFMIIAHRGASAYYPENTMAAFKGAVELGAEMIELDVTLSKDGVPVIFHDVKLNRHSDGKGLVSDHTLEDLKSLDAGSWFHPKFSDQKIPTLEEVLDFASGNIALNIEIKPEAVSNNLDGNTVKKCLDLVHKHDMSDYVLFSSFDYRAAKQLKKLDPKMPAALLYHNRSYNKLPHQLLQDYQADAFNCSYRQLNKKWIADLQEHNIPSFIYTVNKEAKMRALLEAGVTGIFTDKPDVLAQIVKQYQKEK